MLYINMLHLYWSISKLESRKKAKKNMEITVRNWLKFQPEPHNRQLLLLHHDREQFEKCCRL